MSLTALVLFNDVRVAVPTVLLAACQLPYATMAIGVGACSWVLPRRVIHTLDTFLYRSYMRLCLFVFENVSAVQINLYGDIEELKRDRESAIVISNHQTNVDWAIIDLVAARHSRDGAECGLRFVMKYAIHFIPLFGWYVFQARRSQSAFRGYIYVRRGAFAPQVMHRQFDHLLALGDPFWLHIFPEGTRYSRRKEKAIEGSRKFCAERRLPVLTNVLAPRTGAFTLAMKELSASSTAVYDLTIAYGQTRAHGRRGIAPGMLEFVCGPMEHKSVHIHVRRHPIAAVPEDGEGQKRWLFERFVEKDKLMEQFYAEGKFPDIVEASATHISFARTVPPLIGFLGAVALPFFSETVRDAYLLTIASSPLLIAYMHLRGYV